MTTARRRATAVVAVALAVGCQTSLGIDDFRYRCDSSMDCPGALLCLPASSDSEVHVCRPSGGLTAQDVASATDPGTTDAGVTVDSPAVEVASAPEVPAGSGCGELGEPCPEGFTCTSGACVSTDDDGLEVWVPGGTLTLGCPEGDPDCGPYDTSRPTLTLPPYTIDRTEVTVGLYGALASATGCYAASGGEGCEPNVIDGQRPRNCVRHGDAECICGGRSRCLCTEAQWELAARGPGAWRYPWGGLPPDAEHAVFSAEGPDTVGKRPEGASPYGALDMAGNLAELVRDCFHDPYAPPDSGGYPPPCDISPPIHVARGGSYVDDATGLVAWHREKLTCPNAACTDAFWRQRVGFRCCSCL